MVKVFFITDDKEKSEISQAVRTLRKNSMSVGFADANKELQTDIKENNPDAILIDTTFPQGLHECKKLKSLLDKENIPIVYLLSEDTPSDVLKTANAYVRLCDDAVLAATIASQVKNRKTLNSLVQSNADLQKSLYQIDSLYHTSFQLAGTLDKNKLINIMVEGLEKSLSYSLSYAFVIDSSKEIELIINSLHPLTERLEKAIKLRAVLTYKALFDRKKLPYEISVDDINLTKIIKHRYNEYDLNIFKYDNLFSPINIGENFFGFIEIFKETDFTQEDATCFQTLTKQVSVPLESALLYEELKNTNIKLEQLERLKSEFISIVSHELRTPLTAIKNSLDILLSGRTGEMSENGRKFLDNAKRNVVRLSSIINDLLDLSKIEAGKMEFRFERLNINSSLEFMKNTYTALAAEKNIELSIQLLNENGKWKTSQMENGKWKMENNSSFLIPNSSFENNSSLLTPHSSLIYADAVKIEQILSNLISNAIKFTDNSGRIEISTKLISANDINIENVKNGEYILISVKDNGIGIKPEDQERVFDEFRQIENSNTRKIGGTGLGLPIARQLTEAHLGYIWLESVIDEGSTFYLALPVITEENTFILDSIQELQKAKIRKSSVAFLKLKESENTEFSLINEIKNHPELITKAVDLKTFEQIENSSVPSLRGAVATKQSSQILSLSATSPDEDRTVSGWIASSALPPRNDAIRAYTICIPDADKFAVDFILKRLAGVLLQKGLPQQKCDILYTKAIYPDDGADIKKVLTGLDEDFRGFDYD